jgi:heme/copper-type cytochrome/quinol oxidase subunit 3
VSAQGLFVATVAVCLLNGLVSPMVAVAWHLHPVWLPEMLRPTNEVVFYGASLLVSTATLLLSAVPAAIAERAGGLSQAAANGIWLACAALLVLAGLR